MVVKGFIEDTLGLGSAAAMLVAGALLVVLGLGHVFMPETSVVGGLLSMINGVDVTNSLGNVPGLFTRVVGGFVALLGVDMLGDSM